jgi:pilus assembly protein CpaC
METLMRTPDRQRNRSGVPAFFLGGLSIVAGLAFLGSNALAQQPQFPASAAQAPVPAIPGAPSPAQPPQAVAGQSAQESEGPQSLHLLVGRSLVITSPTRIKRVSLADPSIAEAVVVDPNEVLVNGKAPGGVSLIIWDEAGQSQNFEVSVDIDVLGLTQKIHEVFPSEPVQIETSGTVVMLSGKISSAQVADKILEVVKNVTPKVTSLMQVPSVPSAQILLQVRFAEVNRAAISQLGANFLRNFGSNMPLSVTTGQFSPPTLGQTSSVSSNGSTSTTNTSGNDFLISNLLNIAIFRPDLNLSAFIQALQENNLLEILAEPNLLTESGKEASFLAGGQFPYPVLQAVSGGTTPGITIQFKEYGIRLSFTPTMTQEGRIHLKVQPEVSTLDYANAITISGFLLPALATNSATSEMELTDGQSFAIAGLLDNRVTEQFEKIPGIGDIPILGKLFQSRTLNKSKTELLIVVTPHVVQPLAVGQTLPGPTFPKPFLPSATSDEQKPAGK